jgi:hypothetical protein
MDMKSDSLPVEHTGTLATMISQEHQVVDCLGDRIIVPDPLIYFNIIAGRSSRWSGRDFGRGSRDRRCA